MPVALRRPRWLLRLQAEASVELARASLVLALTPGHRRMRVLGSPRPVGRPAAGAPAGDEPVETALLIGRVVRRCATRLAWKPTCLRQALAIRRMLARRGIASSLHVGIDNPRAPAAHAWVQVGERVVGCGGARGFTTVAVFER